MSTTRTVSVILDRAGRARALRRQVFTLKVLRGPDKRKTLRVGSSTLLIGSDEAAQFRLTDPTVSGLHCEIAADESGFRVRDLGAKNGVVLAGRRVSDAWLAPDDEIHLGETVIRFSVTQQTEETELATGISFGKLRGSSIRMRELYHLLERAALSQASVLLQGETGTGKELAADALVSHGPRADAPLVVIDCGRLNGTLAESELFGHEPHAFTGATELFKGAFERADRGTVFLDEIGELPLELQPKLLGALERKSVQRLGGSAPISVDVRIISASHRELEREVNRGTFRADLYYRLAALQIHLPALRDRQEDIPELVAAFMEELPGRSNLSPDVLQRLYSGDYPGNVRELRSAVERVVVGVDEGPIATTRPASVDLDTPYRLQKERMLAGFERAYLSRLLEACAGNLSEAARRSGLNRVYLHEVVARLGLRPGRR